MDPPDPPSNLGFFFLRGHCPHLQLPIYPPSLSSSDNISKRTRPLTQSPGYTSNAAKSLQKRLLVGTADFNIHCRTLGSVIYFMCSQTSKLEDVRRWEQVIEEALKMDSTETSEEASGKIVEAYDTRTFL